MATRKSSSTAVTTTKAANLPADIQAQLAAEAAGIVDRIGAPTGVKIRTNNKQFTLPDGTTDPGPIDVVIVDFVAKNAFYEGKYDPNNIQPPTCFSIGTVLSEMVPSDNSIEKQAESCAKCPLNQFGSDGNGKACKNSRLLAVLPRDGSMEDQMMTLEVSPTGIKRFDAYVGTLANKLAATPVQVVTEIGFNDAVDYSSLVFGQPEPNQMVAEHYGRKKEAQALLFREPDMSAEEQAPAAKTTSRRGAARGARKR